MMDVANLSFFSTINFSNLEVLIFRLQWMYHHHVQRSTNTLNYFLLAPC
jgi:hypothetical protein